MYLFKLINELTVKSVVIIYFLGISFGITSQEAESMPPIGTDRPDATESSATVPPGTVQIETGGFYTSYEEADVKQEVLGYNTTLIRLGLVDMLELRLGWNFEEGRTTSNGLKNMNVTSGFSPLLAGAKVGITKEEGWLPEIALLVHAYIPATASRDYKPENVTADFRFSLSHTLSERSSIGYNLGAQWGETSSENAYIYTLAYGYGISEKFGLYAELYGDLPKNSSPNHFWDAGITYLLMNNLQLDATVGSGITDGQDLLLSAGVSYRMPN